MKSVKLTPHNSKALDLLTDDPAYGKIILNRTNVLYGDGKSALKLISRMALWVQIRRVLRSLVFAVQILRSDSHIGRALQDMASRELRYEDEIAKELLASAIARRQAADDNLFRWKELTPREQEVSALTCLELTNIEIAKFLEISPETVKTHVRNVLAKFNLRSKDELRRVLEDWDFNFWVEKNVPNASSEVANKG
jgi:DNA-binding CsgD family transcriptional regulator